jgi:hypothetical protein
MLRASNNLYPKRRDREKKIRFKKLVSYSRTQSPSPKEASRSVIFKHKNWKRSHHTHAAIASSNTHILYCLSSSFSALTAFFPIQGHEDPLEILYASPVNILLVLNYTSTTAREAASLETISSC